MEETGQLTKKQQLVVTVASALTVAVAFQAMTIARNNYNLWRLEVMAIEVGGALIASFAANAFRSIEQRGQEWASSLVSLDEGALHHVLSILPAVLVRAALITALLSIPNATYVPMVIYREVVELPALAVIVRFLADIPQATLLCLVVRLVVERIERLKG